MQWKWLLILGIFVLSIGGLYPTINWYTKTSEERNQLERSRLRPNHILNLGLDLRGGSYLLLELDVSKLKKTENVRDAVDRAIEIIRNRVDQYGVSEVPISRQGDRWIAVQLPGVSNPEQAKEIIGKTALLEFTLVDTSAQAQKLLERIAEEGTPFDEDGNLLPEISTSLPKGTALFRAKERGYYILSSTPIITGAYLEDAMVKTGQNFGYPSIGFEFNAKGGKIFARFTGANIGKNLAIVLDGVVHSAPVINSRISGGSGVIEGTFTMEEARNLAIVLRAGALPAPVKIIEERTIGPGLGEDSIKAGLIACVTGFIAVIVFMAFYYKFSGLIADAALLLNFVFLAAIMSYLNATLTLPGIAGIILSLAMAIDANVLIIERIREERLSGKPVALCIPTGFEKAWSAIIDSNITNWIAAVFLFQFGSGPVKGFAVTLFWGLGIGVFTSVFVTRAIYDFWLKSNPRELSI